MAARAWLRYPPRIIRQTRTCPTDRPRFPSAAHALRSVPAGLHTSTATTVCEQCGGVHLVRPQPAVTATPYRPNTPKTRRNHDHSDHR